MSYSLKYNLIFVHIPKNAGTSLIESMGFGEHGHAGVLHERFWKLCEEHPTATTFAVVRNPWDRLVSTYEYLRMENSYWHGTREDAPYPLYECHHRASEVDFGEFIQLIWDNDPALCQRNEMIKPQFHWICNNRLDIMLNRVFRMGEGEGFSLEQHMRELTGDVDLELKKLNPSTDTNSSSPARDYRKYYDEESKKIVEKLYEVDIKLFGYTFN